MVLDDFFQIEYVAKYQTWTQIWWADSFQLFRPVKNLLFYLIQGLAYKNMAAWHAIGMLCYLFGGTGVFVLLRRVFGDWRWAIVGAALWMLAPTQVSTVIWVSCANISLAAGFLAFSLVQADRAYEVTSRSKCIGHWIFAMLLMVLAQLSYETAVAIPVLLVGLDWFRKRPIFSRAGIARYGCAFLITFVYLIIRSKYGATFNCKENPAFDPAMTQLQLFFSASWIFWRHVGMWVAPIERIEWLSTYVWGKSASTAGLIAAWMGLIALLGTILYCMKRFPLVAFGLFWLLMVHVPSSNFLPNYSGPVEDYYTVIPSIGTVIVMIAIARKIIELRAPVVPESWKKVMMVVLIAMGVWRAFAAVYFALWANVWGTPTMMYFRVSEVRPYQFQNKLYVAIDLIKAKEFAAAKEIALAASKDGPWCANLSVALGEIYNQEGNTAEAVEQYETALKNFEMPTVDDAMLSKLRLAAIYGGDPAKREQAKKYLRDLLEPSDHKFHAAAVYQMARVYALEGNKEKSIVTLERGVRLNPANHALIKTLEDAKAGLYPGSRKVDKEPITPYDL